MASTQRNVDFVLEQMAEAGDVSTRKMFGEYAIYCRGKVVALFCDDQLFVKPTDAGRAFLGKVKEAPPYPGATERALPPAKPKPAPKRSTNAAKSTRNFSEKSAPRATRQAAPGARANASNRAAKKPAPRSKKPARRS
jgi:TfoX/Sxy family transcriptional regulator of competence genes